MPTGTTVELVCDLYDDHGLHVVTPLSSAPRQPEVRALAAPSDSAQWTPARGLGYFGRASNNGALPRDRLEFDYYAD